MELNKTMPKIAMGAWAWGNDGTFGDNYTAADLKEVYETAMQNGLNLWDTAFVYGMGTSEKILGELTKDAGSLQYASIPMLAASVHPLYAFLMALMINARHLFYGISMLGKYHDTGARKPYLIFSLTDETFSVVCDEHVPEYMNSGKLYFLISLFDQCYWVLGTLIGCLIGSVITFNSAGLDFALTALFVVIFTNQWMEQKDHSPAITGVLATFLCLRIFGEEYFIIPSMVVILAILVVGYFHSDKKKDTPVGKEGLNYDK